MNISIIIPSYNEAENLKILLPKLNKVLIQLNVNYEVLVIDTKKSMDNTYNICKKYRVKYINRENGNFYGDAIRTGISYAIGEYIIIMDSDGSHNPKDIRRFYKEIKKGKYDIVIGSRYCKGGNSHNSFILKLMSWVLNYIYRIVFRLKIKDISNSYRMYNTKKLKSIQLECDNFDIVEEILIKLKMKYNNLLIKEIPIYFNKRLYGESKRDLFKFILSYMKTMKKLYNISRRKD